MPRQKKTPPPPRLVVAEYKSHDDGDTCFVVGDLFAIVRVALIDTPELPHTAQDRKLNDAIVEAQYRWGKAAKEAIASKIAETSKELTLTVTGFDSKYNRNIAAVVFSDGTDWGSYLVDRGLALVYTKYAIGIANYDALCIAQETAKTQGLGFWSDPNFKEPTEFRKYKENLCK